MKLISNKTGLKRIRDNRFSYQRGSISNYLTYPKAEMSDDSKIRRDIHAMLVKIAKENKSSIEIKIVLTEKYPEYEEYIIKMINQYFNKANSHKSSRSSNEEKGDER